MVTHVIPILMATVLQCSGSDGIPYFTDRDCPDGRAIIVEAPSIYVQPRLTATELRRLQALETEERQQARKLRARKRSPRRDRSQLGNRELRAVDECETVRQQLRELRDSRRRGYSVKVANELEEREQALKRDRQRICK